MAYKRKLLLNDEKVLKELENIRQYMLENDIKVYYLTKNHRKYERYYYMGTINDKTGKMYNSTIGMNEIEKFWEIVKNAK